jgi:oligopeptide/dipeptide ABC transporter ATP-binding protein
MKTDETLISLKNLGFGFSLEEGFLKAVDNVSFDIKKGKTLALVGESGCGKSVTALSILRLIPMPPGKILAGSIKFEDKDLLRVPQRHIRKVRGNKISMIFQEPMTSLNPVYTVGDQIIETLQQHRNIQLEQAWNHAVKMLEKVGIADSEQRVNEYPHQMSGGMRQRVMIAMALSCDPSLLIADEPTTALDVTIQAQILDLLNQLQKDKMMSILLITHDLGVVAENASDVVVMYASRIAEKADVVSLFENPLHPYTQGLMKSLPRLGQKKQRLDVIGGTVPNPLQFPTGCKFHPRCPIGMDKKKCRQNEPKLRDLGNNRSVACWFAKGYDQAKDLE